MSSAADYRDEQRIDHMLKALEALVRNSVDVDRDMFTPRIMSPRC